MAEQIKTGNFEDSFEIHQHYLDILNCVPDIVYWIDSNCNLQGCNQSFIQLLGLESTNDLKGSPYDLMIKFTHWSKERVDAFRLDDMKAIFSGHEQMDIEEPPVFNQAQEPTYFRSRRVPLFDNNHQVIGLVVTFCDISELKKIEQQTKQAKPIQQEAAQDHIVSPNVLMVEDNQVAQKVEEALLTALDCQVDIADTGDKAIKLFNPGKYDMVFMDIGLEDTSGYLVAKKIRELEEKTKFHVPIIALTSFQADRVKNDCKDYFMDGVLSKPLTSEQAEQLIKHFVQHEDVEVEGLCSASEE